MAVDTLRVQDRARRLWRTSQPVRLRPTPHVRLPRRERHPAQRPLTPT
jgi:hypothetical protein